MNNRTSKRWAAHYRRVAAIHESGHAIAALACGADVYEVSIVPSVGPNGPRLGHCDFSLLDDEDEATATLAGGVAERLWWPRRNAYSILNGCWSDYRYVSKIAKRLFDEDKARERFWQCHKRRARAILSENRHIVDSVATILENQGAIEIDFFRRISPHVKGIYEW